MEHEPDFSTYSSFYSFKSHIVQMELTFATLFNASATAFKSHIVQMELCAVPFKKCELRDLNPT